MKNVTYISAGAGSGKTYSLTHILSDLLKDKKVNPEGVILTTFTEKAASDFKERAKGVLYENGMYSEATRIDQAMIGTIHSVAYSFIKKYWFYLGLSPEMGVLTDEDKEVYINQSLADLPTGEELEQLIGFAEKFNISHPYSQDPKAPRGINEDFWKHHLSDIIGYSTNFSITDYTTSREKSLAFIRQFVKNDITFTTDEIKAVIDEHLAFMLTKGDSDANKKRIKAIREAKRHANNPTIDSLKKLAGTIGSPKGFGPLAAAFKEKYAGIWNSKYIYDQQESYITLIFTLADRWRDNFAEFKRQRNLLDYNDMEKYMLQLIQHPEVQQDIRESYKYLFVDEFQDCSPIQVKIFDQLSELVHHSYWVGDYKQAIYGFRGSDTLLTKAVVDRIEQEAFSDSQGEGGCDTRTLEYSYRSQPEIVDVCNKVFTRTFDGILDKSKVELKVPEGKKQTIDRSLRWWMLANEKDEEDSGTTIPFEVYRMIAHEHIEPKDIAVLCRNNYPLDDLMPEFEQYGIPVNRASMPIMETKATQLVLALLSLMVNDRDSLARCQVAYYTQQGYNAEAIIDQRLHNLQHEDCDVHFLEDVDLIRKLLDIRPEIRNQSVGAMVESLIIELGLYDVVKSFGSTQQNHAALDTLIRCAMQYETSCVQINKPATITGYMQWLDAQQPAAEGNTDGVNLMTFHGSKGLEWKHVILMSMDEEPTKRNKMIQHEAYGVHAIHDQTPSANNLFPEVYIRVSPWIFGPSAFGRIQTPADYIEQLYDEKQNPVFAKQRLDVLNESNRVLYVGMTRASETLTIALTEAGMTWAQCVGIQDAGTAEIDNDGNWDMFSTGNSFMYDNTTDAGIIDSLTDTSLQFEDPMDSKAINYSAPRPDNGPRDLSPSQLPHKASEDCEVTLIAQSSERIPLKSNLNSLATERAGESPMAIVGDCIHQIFANIEQNMTNNAYFDRIVSDYGLDKVLTDKSAIIGSWAYLLAKLQELYGTEAEKYHERPFKQLLDGHIYTGSIDFTYKTPAGTVLIDFKTCPMGKSEILNPKSNFYAGIYQPQFQCYTHALEAACENVIAKLVYYPVSGILVELKYEDQPSVLPDDEDTTEYDAENDDEPDYPTPDNIISVNVSLDEFNAVLEGKQSFVDVTVDLSNFRDILMNIEGNLMLCCDEMPDTFYSCYFWNNGTFPYLVKEELKYIVLVNQTRALYLSIKGNTPSIKNRCLFTKQNTTVLDPDGDACIWNIRFDIQVESYGGIDSDESHHHQTFLLRWNPAISSMTLDRYHNGIEKDWDRGVFDWSVYDWRNAHRGDAFYMLREGDDDCAGIVFRGVFESDPYTDDDWRGSDQQRRYCLYLINEEPSSVNGKPHITMEQLQQNLPDLDWHKGHSGELLTDEQADILSKLWEA